MTISEMLAEGKENAVTAKHLSDVLGKPVRTITAMIEAERKQGVPICASCDTDNAGYYLPIDDRELREYVSSFDRRITEMTETRNAVASSLLQ